MFRRAAGLTECTDAATMLGIRYLDGRGATVVLLARSFKCSRRRGSSERDASERFSQRAPQRADVSCEVRTAAEANRSSNCDGTESERSTGT